MEKFIVFGKYCEDAINKREPFRKNHLDRLGDLKDKNIIRMLGSMYKYQNKSIYLLSNKYLSQLIVLIHFRY